MAAIKLITSGGKPIHSKTRKTQQCATLGKAAAKSNVSKAGKSFSPDAMEKTLANVSKSTTL